MLQAVNYARWQPGVSVVSMSWGSSEFAGEVNYDSDFTTPPDHAPVAFVASSGDQRPACLVAGSTRQTCSPSAARN